MVGNGELGERDEESRDMMREDRWYVAQCSFFGSLFQALKGEGSVSLLF